MTGITIESKVKTDFDMARKYFSVLFAANDIKLTASELDLITFCSIKGTFSTPPIREEFIKQFNVHKNTVYNMLAKLQKQNILVKDENKKIRVNPQILTDFQKPIILQIKLRYE